MKLLPVILYNFLNTQEFPGDRRKIPSDSPLRRVFAAIPPKFLPELTIWTRINKRAYYSIGICENYWQELDRAEVFVASWNMTDWLIPSRHVDGFPIEYSYSSAIDIMSMKQRCY
jgi:hypothetical protein